MHIYIYIYSLPSDKNLNCCSCLQCLKSLKSVSSVLYIIFMKNCIFPYICPLILLLLLLLLLLLFVYIADDYKFWIEGNFFFCTLYAIFRFQSVMHLITTSQYSSFKFIYNFDFHSHLTILIDVIKSIWLQGYVSIN